MPENEIGILLDEWSRGRLEALDQLAPLVYVELRKLAKAVNRGENPGNTLQTTALVHEAYLRISEGKIPALGSPAQFYGFVSKVMRNLVVEAARKRKSLKRGGNLERIPLEAADGQDEPRPLSPEVALALDSALSRLSEVAPRQAQVVELHFFAGQTHREISELLQIGESTARGDWQAARKYLVAVLSVTSPK